jgi:undecaprenyl-phosphate galactose phosphotransferase
MAHGAAQRRESAESVVAFGPTSRELSYHAPISYEVNLRSKIEHKTWTGKRALDIVGTICLAVVASPIIAVVTIWLWLTDGPILFGHRRIGQNGKQFTCYKFRTMVPNAEQVLEQLFEREPDLRVEWLLDHKLRNDPRVTSIGKFLRQTSLDELPQLWNVLKGEMSLVGPRPIVRDEIFRYGRAIRHYLALKPGVTGLWQVSGRNDTGYQRRVALDRAYAMRSSLRLDISILCRTILIVLGRRGAY